MSSSPAGRASLFKEMRSIFQKLLDVLVPPRCPMCGVLVSEVSTLCPDCFSKLHFISNPRCQICGRPFEFALTNDCLCPQCLNHPPSFQKARAAVVYNHDSKKIILPFKHNDRIDLGPLISKLMFVAAEELISDVDIICPVPLHQFRLIKRKYNQSALLACQLARRYQKNYCPDLLKRTRSTSSQGHLKAQDRKQNVAHAFAVKRPNLIPNKKILLVDDVLTTGATANECSKVLLAAGATSISLVTFAATLPSIIEQQND